MRTLLIAALAVSTVPSSDADACGGYMFQPRVFLMTNHTVPDASGTWQTRTFAILRTDAPADAAWRQLGPGTYDHSRIAIAPVLDRDFEVTLVGPGGKRVVSSREQVFLDSAWHHSTPKAALEVKTGGKDFTIALAGRHHDAAWIALDQVATKPSDADWVTAQGLAANDPAHVYVSRLQGTDYETVATFDGTRMVTFLRVNGQLSMRLDGNVIGAVSMPRGRFILVERDNVVSAIAA